MRGPAKLSLLLATATASVLVGAGVAGAQLASPAALPATHVSALAPACGRDYYKNASGHCVHRPAASPAGATARCRDGSYSYSEHASGTCSHHGGVARWIHHP